MANSTEIETWLEGEAARRDMLLDVGLAAGLLALGDRLTISRYLDMLEVDYACRRGHREPKVAPFLAPSRKLS